MDAVDDTSWTWCQDKLEVDEALTPGHYLDPRCPDLGCAVGHGLLVAWEAQKGLRGLSQDNGERTQDTSGMQPW